MALPSTRMSLIAMALVVAMAAESAHAQEATLTDQPTTGTFGQTPIGRVVSGLNPANWKMPKMPTFQQVMPGEAEKTRIKQKKNSLVTEVSETASKSWSKTKEVLNPKRLLPSNLFGQRPQTPTPPKQVKQVGFFESLLRPMPPETQPGPSVNDFLKQKKPITQ